MAGFWDTEELLGVISKNSREEIQVKKVTRGGREFVDIRTFWLDAEENEYKPSQKGIAVPYQFKDKILEFLEKA